MAQVGRLRLGAVGVTFVSLVPVAWTLASAHVDSLTTDVSTLSSDAAAGRVTGTPEAESARNYIMTRLFQAGYSGRVTTQAISGGGTNVLAWLPGSGTLATEYVLVGAHYDHVPLDERCTPKGDPKDVICNGATDNAAGVAVLLDIAEHFAAAAPAPRRGVYFAFWDREETDCIREPASCLGGSVAYRSATLPPWPQPVAYINYDIQGANLARSLRTTTFAVGASSGGSRLASAVTEAAAAEGVQLKVRHLSESLGQYLSDYATFLAPRIVHKGNPSLPAWLPRVPTVFFTDSNGPCYHTTQDEVGVVDFQKLDRQAKTGLRLVRDLATGTKPSLQPLPLEASMFGTLFGPLVQMIRPEFTPPYPAIPPPSYADALELLDVARTARDDPGLGPEAQRTIDEQLPTLEAIVAKGQSAYRPLVDGLSVAWAAFNAMPAMQAGECDGFLEGG